MTWLYRTQMGEKPYQSDLCKKAFAQHESLGEYLRTHIGEKLHKCNECDKTFSHLGNSKRHMRTHILNGPSSS